MNPVPLFLIIVSLPLLLGGCGEKATVEPVTEVKPELEGVNEDKLDYREGIIYLKGSDAPYTGKWFGLYENGQKGSEGNYKDGKEDGLYEGWYENGKKQCEINYNDGEPDGLEVYWYKNGQKEVEANYKDGKPDGLYLEWHENSKKKLEENWKNGKKISKKFWNRKGESVDSRKEAEAE